ncbi:F-box protein At3g12350-like [Apium graveolens]|uniref:F-box protein At3g12350-like n=1 Tax=Apium graveolens TaxID=4045 RepID=UPI003D7ADB87
MTTPQNDTVSIPFPDFPEDVQLTILSFLNQSEISAFSCTSKRFYALCSHDSKLWFSLCDRKFGSKTRVSKWVSGQITYKRLYKTLCELDGLIGFWRRSGERIKNCGNGNAGDFVPALLFFQWGDCCVTGCRVSPSKEGGYGVVKRPCFWICLNSEGECVSFLDPNCKVEVFDELVRKCDDLGFVENELIPVYVNFMGKCHVVVEENLNYVSSGDSGEIRKSGVVKVGREGSPRGEEVEEENVVGSPVMSDMYQYFANRTSPGAGGERWSRRQRRREKVKKCWKKWEPEHYVKIVNCSPTPSRPLQGLWKGICDDMKLDFYLVAYDDIGGIACRRVEDSSKPFSGYAPVFWTSDTTFIESPFSPEESYIYDSRTHLRPPEALDYIHGDEAVSRILYINSSYDLVIPDLAETSVNPRQVEGRIWQYDNGTFGFGFLRDNHIVDLKLITRNDNLLDTC